MRHKKKRIAELRTWIQKKQNVVRNLITSLIKDGQLTTTPKRAKVLKSEIDKFFSRLLRQFDMFDNEKDQKREVVKLIKSIVYTENEWKKVADDLLIKYRERGIKSWFTRDFKLWPRSWDNVEKILIRLI